MNAEKRMSVSEFLLRLEKAQIGKNTRYVVKRAIAAIKNLPDYITLTPYLEVYDSDSFVFLAGSVVQGDITVLILEDIISDREITWSELHDFLVNLGNKLNEGKETHKFITIVSDSLVKTFNDCILPYIDNLNYRFAYSASNEELDRNIFIYNFGRTFSAGPFFVDKESFDTLHKILPIIKDYLKIPQYIELFQLNTTNLSGYLEECVPKLLKELSNPVKYFEEVIERGQPDCTYYNIAVNYKRSGIYSSIAQKKILQSSTAVKELLTQLYDPDVEYIYLQPSSNMTEVYKEVYQIKKSSIRQIWINNFNFICPEEAI